MHRTRRVRNRVNSCYRAPPPAIWRTAFPQGEGIVRSKRRRSWAMSSQGYLPHLSDPLRRRIAERYIKHELIKLFPTLRDITAWDTIEGDIAAWFGDNPTLAPTRDFWNGVHGFSMGFKLKDLVPMLTSLNIHWVEREMPTEELWFSSRLQELAHIGPNLSARATRDWYFASKNRAALEEARRAHEVRSAETMPRDDFPVIAKQSGAKTFVHDGNRRVLRAVLFEIPRIPAAVGTPVGFREIYEHWVPTHLLLALVELFRAHTADHTIFEATAQIIARLIRDSSAGRSELVDRCLREDIEEDALLRDQVAEILGAQGIALP